eukprot:TRINITY_DN66446_c0_g2_i1.p1 TRINITY_DN66446_c0_g2~~TRINITY_DN66446_c0_g2_i1.p1  ORF type:complete len:1081 (+),score=140.50 TRINITY_DN66446_c0_g2_i1:81-3245(+)
MSVQDVHTLEETINMVRSNEPQVTQIHLASRKVTDDDCKSLSEAMKSNSSVLVMDLQSNKITTEGADYICDFLKVNKHLTELNLTNNFLGDKGGQLLDEVLDTNNTLTALYLDLNTISGRLEERIQTKIKLNSQPLDFKHAYPLLQSNDSSFQVLDLSNYDSVPFSCSMLADAIVNNTSLLEVNLANVGIGDKGTETFARMLIRGGPIKRVNLANNNIGVQGMKDLAEALTENNVVQWLNVEMNKGGDEGCRYFIEAMKKNDSVSYLNLSQNRASLKLMNELKAAVEINNNPLSLKKAMFAAQSNKSDAVINFSTHGMMKHSAKMLSSALKDNTTTVHLNLANNMIGDTGVRELAAVLHVNRTLKTLDLPNNQISTFGSKALSDAMLINNTVTDINLANNRIGNDAGRAWLAALKEVHSLIALNLELNDVDGALMDEIEDAVQLNLQPLALKTVMPRIQQNDEKLWELDFSTFDGRYHTDKSVKQLARALKTNTHITKLDLSNNNVGDQGAAALASVLKVNRALTSINLTGNAVGDKGALTLAEALKANGSLATLVLDHNSVTDKGADALLEVMGTNHALKTVTFECNRATGVKSQQIRAACNVNATPITLKELIPKIQSRDRTTARLNLSHHNYDDTAIEILCEELIDNTVCRRLNLSFNMITPRGAQALARLISKNNTLEKINLAGNKLKDEGATIIAHALMANTCLHILDLQNNEITDTGIEALVEVVSKIQDNDPSIRRLNFSEPGEDDKLYDDVSCRILAVALLNNTFVTKLNLSNNKIGPEGAAFLADLLEENQTLRVLNLNQNKIGDEGGEALIKALTDRNDTLTELWTEGNGLSNLVTQRLGFCLQMNNVPSRLKSVIAPIEKNDTSIPRSLDFNGTSLNVPFDDNAGRLLWQALALNEHVTEIDLSNNELSDICAAQLATMLRHNNTLLRLDLSCNQFGGGSEADCRKRLQPVAKAIMSNSTIQEINFEGNCIPFDILEDINAALNVNAQPLTDRGNKARARIGDDVDDSEFHTTDYFSQLEHDIQFDAMRDESVLKGTKYNYVA